MYVNFKPLRYLSIKIAHSNAYTWKQETADSNIEPLTEFWFKEEANQNPKSNTNSNEMSDQDGPPRKVP
jgi:hypothetical protein